MTPSLRWAWAWALAWKRYDLNPVPNNPSLDLDNLYIYPCLLNNVSIYYYWVNSI